MELENEDGDETPHRVTLAPGIGWLHVVVLPEGTIEVSANEDGAVIGDEPVAATPLMVLDYLGATGLAVSLQVAAGFANRADYL